MLWTLSGLLTGWKTISFSITVLFHKLVNWELRLYRTARISYTDVSMDKPITITFYLLHVFVKLRRKRSPMLYGPLGKMISIILWQKNAWKWKIWRPKWKLDDHMKFDLWEIEARKQMKLIGIFLMTSLGISGIEPSRYICGVSQ
jgi:hypothetical protein